MPNYLEIIELSQDGFAETAAAIGQLAFVRVEVVDKAEAISELPNFEPAFAGLNYIKRYHECHNPDMNQCNVEEL